MFCISQIGRPAERRHGRSQLDYHALLRQEAGPSQNSCVELDACWRFASPFQAALFMHGIRRRRLAFLSNLGTGPPLWASGCSAGPRPQCWRSPGGVRAPFQNRSRRRSPARSPLSVPTYGLLPGQERHWRGNGHALLGIKTTVPFEEKGTEYHLVCNGSRSMVIFPDRIYHSRRNRMSCSLANFGSMCANGIM